MKRRKNNVGFNIKMTAEQFNRRWTIGQRVWYHPVIGQPERVASRTRGEAWTLGSGDPVVLLEGHAGGISLRAVEIIENEAE